MKQIRRYPRCDPRENCVFPRGGTPLNGLYEYVRPKSIWFSDPSVIHTVWFLFSRRELGMFIEEATFSSFFITPLTRV